MSFFSDTPTCPTWEVVPRTWPANFSSIIFAICRGSILPRHCRSKLKAQAQHCGMQKSLWPAIAAPGRQKLFTDVVLFLDLFLEFDDAMHQGFGPRRAARDIHVHGNDI